MDFRRLSLGDAIAGKECTHPADGRVKPAALQQGHGGSESALKATAGFLRRRCLTSEYVAPDQTLIVMRDTDVLNQERAAGLAGFAEIYEAHKDLVFNVCFRMVGDWHEAEDLAQEVFVKAYRAMDRLRGEAKASTWLYRIAVNACLNHQRRKQRVRWLSLDFLFESRSETEVGLPASEQSPFDELTQRETETLVQDAVNSLPLNQRAVLVLQVYEGLSYEEIAAVMKCSVASVDSRLHRAKENLARRLVPQLRK
jgi:RNA polymerase sigma-70 factor (ECF subfamily)